MLSDRFEHALRLMVILCRNAPSHHSLAELTHLAQFPEAEVHEYLLALQQGGLVKPGWTCTIPSNEITLLRVIQLVAPIRRITSCPMGYAEHGLNLCPLHRTIDNALGALETAFQRTTIHHLLHQPETNRPLCRFPHLPTATMHSPQ